MVSVKYQQVNAHVMDAFLHDTPMTVMAIIILCMYVKMWGIQRSYNLTHVTLPACEL